MGIHPTLSDDEVIAQFWNFVCLYPSWSPSELLRQKHEGDQVIAVLGSRNRQVPQHAAALYRSLKQALPHKKIHVLITGSPPIDGSPNALPEAEFFRRMMVEHGVPDRDIILEMLSKNTLENARMGMAMLKGRKIQPRRLFLVGVPFHMRRAVATFQKEVEHLPCEIVPCPPEGKWFDVLPYSSERLIHALANEVVKLRDYGNWDHIVRTEVPEKLLTLAMEVGIKAAPPPQQPTV